MPQSCGFACPPLAQCRGLSKYFSIPTFSVSQEGQAPFRKGKAAPLNGCCQMRISPGIAECLDALCINFNLPLLKLVEQDNRESGDMASLIERSEMVADALRFVLIFNRDKRTLQRRLERELSCGFF